MQVVEISETHLQEMIVKEDVGPVYPCWEKWVLLCPVMSQQREYKDCSWMECFRKEVPNGTLKKPSVPQKGKYEWMGHSSVLLQHVREWWERCSCCKKGKGSSLSAMTWEQDSNRGWLRWPATLQQLQSWSEGQSTHHWLPSRGWLRAGKCLSLAAGLEPSVKILCFANFRFADCLQIAVLR